MDPKQKLNRDWSSPFYLKSKTSTVGWLWCWKRSINGCICFPFEVLLG